MNMKNGEPRYDHSAGLPTEEQKGLYGRSMPVREMWSALREEKIDPMLFPRLNSIDTTQAVLHKTDDGTLLLSGEGKEYSGIRFVYRLQPGHRTAEVLYDSNSNGVSKNECLLTEVFGFQLGKIRPASEMREKLGAFLALSSEQVAQLFPRLAAFTGGTFVNYGKHHGVLSVHGQGEQGSQLTFSYGVELATGRVTLAYMNEANTATGEGKIYAEWNPETHGNRPKDVQ